MNSFNKKNEMKDGIEDVLQLSKHTQASKMKITICFVLSLTFFFTFAVSFSYQGE